MEIPISALFPLSSLPILSSSLTRYCFFSDNFLGHPATSRCETDSNLFVSSSSSIIYSLQATNLSVGGEIQERKIPKNYENCPCLPEKISTNLAETIYWDLQLSSLRTQCHLSHHHWLSNGREMSGQSSGHRELPRKI